MYGRPAARVRHGTGGARPGGGLGEAAGTPLGKPSMPWGTIRLVVVVLGGMVMVWGAR